jgi:hypothetical protein
MNVQRWTSTPFSQIVTVQINVGDKFIYEGLIWEVTAFDEVRMHCWCQQNSVSVDFPNDSLARCLMAGYFKFLPKVDTPYVPPDRGG